MLKYHTEKQNSFFFKETLKEIETDCINLREMIKRKREKRQNKTLKDIFFLNKTLSLRRCVSRDTTFYILPFSTQIFIQS